MASVPGVNPSNYSTLADGAQYIEVTSPYTQTNSTNGTTYYFVVTAANGFGESAQSTEVSATPLAGIRSFTPTDDMAAGRFGHTATLLPNDTVLVAGGFGGSVYLDKAEIYDPSDGTFSATGTMTSARYGHSATLLADGTVLMAGGVWVDSTGLATALDTAEIYDPTAGTFSTAGTMKAVRYRHTATLLPDGTVLVAGGSSGNILPLTAEIYDPNADTFSVTGTMGTARFGHTATLLVNGTVLMAGGFNGSGNLKTAELYDPDAGTFGSTGAMTTERVAHTATLLANGTVLMTGGFGTIPLATGGFDTIALATAEIYDPGAGTFSATGSSMTGSRFLHTATLLPDGTVFLSGGRASVSNVGSLASATVYDPTAGTFSATGNMRAARIGHTATLLPNDMVLVAGGFNGTASLAGAELFQ
jgi:hypothetical protein